MHRLIVIAAAAICLGFGRPARAEAPFRFLHITDTHVTATSHQQAVADLVRDASAMSPRPAFVLNTGDITETGRPEEFARYRERTDASPIPFRNCPGNHDVRWSPLGKQAYAEALKDRYSSFTQEGVHFVLLDSTLLLEHEGHFDAAMLAWLEKDLRKLRRGVPVVLAFHHPVGSEPASVDNEESLLRIIAPYNVVAMFVGHGHRDLQWRVNGIPCFMAQPLYQGSYHVVEVGEQSLIVKRVTRQTPAGQVIATIPRAARGRRSVGFAWDDPNIPFLARRRLLAELRVDDKQISDEKAVCTLTLDEGKAVRMPVDTRDKKGLSYIAEFETAGLGDGAHRARIEIVASDGEKFRRDEWFRVERMDGHPRLLWDDPAQAGDAIRSSPCVAEDRVYASSLDGKVYAFDARSGKQRWAAAAKGAFCSSPVFADGAIYVGSLDQGLYAFDARTGRQKWRFDAGSPLFATPAVTDGVVCIGGDRAIYGLDAATGKLLWKQEARGFFQSRAAAANGLFFLGGWGNTFYALDARTGTPKWTATMGRTDGGRGEVSFYFSPAVASPAVGDGLVYVCSIDGVLHALNQNTGAEEWTARAPAGGDPFGYPSPLCADGRIYLGGRGSAGRGSFYALDARTGALIWTCATGADNAESGAALAGDCVAVGSAAGKLSWIDRATGKVRRQYTLDDSHCVSTPACSGDATYMTTLAGRVVALQAP